MDNDFDNVTWSNETASKAPTTGPAGVAVPPPAATTPPPAARPAADPIDLAGISLGGTIDCEVGSPQKEGATKDAYISYQVKTTTDFKSFQKPVVSVRRRFTDFVFLFKSLATDYPACGVPPLPDRQRMEYVRGDRFGSDFTARRAHSLGRFLRRITLHPQLRRSTILVIFLESTDWNSHMRLRPARSPSGSESVFDNFADTFVNAFSKVHRPDKRFIEVKDKSDKLDEDLGHIEKIVARIARRDADLESDYADLATQFLKLAVLEPGVEVEVHSFAQSVENSSRGIGKLRDTVDQDYLTSLKDMEAYSGALKGLLKTREQKQLDFEGLTEYLSKAVSDRDSLASTHPSSALSSPTGFLRSKLEDVRGVDHEAARRERIRKLEMQIDRLTREVEDARKTAELFDEEVIREVTDFERIKAAEFRDTLGSLASSHVEFYERMVHTWEEYIDGMDKQLVEETGRQIRAES